MLSAEMKKNLSVCTQSITKQEIRDNVTVGLKKVQAYKHGDHGKVVSLDRLVKPLPLRLPLLILNTQQLPESLGHAYFLHRRNDDTIIGLYYRSMRGKSEVLMNGDQDQNTWHDFIKRAGEKAITVKDPVMAIMKPPANSLAAEKTPFLILLNYISFDGQPVTSFFSIDSDALLGRHEILDLCCHPSLAFIKEQREKSEGKKGNLFDMLSSSLN